jgi:hypothetical protein
MILLFICLTHSQDSIPTSNIVINDSTPQIPELPVEAPTIHKWQKYAGLSLLGSGIITTTAGITSFSLKKNSKNKTGTMTYDETIKDANKGYLDLLAIFAIFIGPGITITGGTFLAKYHHSIKESKLTIYPFYSEKVISLGVILRW